MAKSRSRAQLKRNIDPWPSRMCGLLSSDLRRALLVALGKGSQDVSTLAKSLGVSIPLVSRNLGALFDEGLVEVTKDAKRRVYSLTSRVRVTQSGKTSMSLRIASTNSHVLKITQPRRSK